MKQTMFMNKTGCYCVNSTRFCCEKFWEEEGSEQILSIYGAGRNL